MARHRYVTHGPYVGAAGVPVRWDHAIDPLAVTPLRAADDPRWTRVALMGSPQRAGKTELGTNFILAALEQAGTNVFYFAASAVLAQDVWQKKIAPALLASAKTEPLLPLDREAAGTKERRDFTNKTSLFVRGSESRGALASATAPRIVADDVQAMRVFPEGDHPVDVAQERADAYPADQRRYLLLGQPGTVDDYLARTLFASAFYVPFVPCPKCGTYQLLEWGRLQFDSTNPRKARTGAWLKCAHADCHHKIRRRSVPGMLRDHLWVSTPPGKNWITEPTEGGTWIDPAQHAVYPDTRRDTTVAGFWRSALYWRFADWGALAAEYLEGRGNPEKVINFQKRIRAVPWKEPEVDEDKLTEAELTQHAAKYPAGHIPDAADVVTVGVDVQSGYVYYIVRAWRKSDGETWLIDLGTCGKPLKGLADESKRDRGKRRAVAIAEGLEEVAELAAAGWPVIDAAGEIIGQRSATICVVDRGYEKDVVGGWWQTRGRQQNWRMVLGQKAGIRLALWPAKPRLDDRQRPYRPLDVSQAKTVLRRLLRIPRGQSGYWHFPAAGVHTNTVRAYHRHLTSEEWRTDFKTPRWEKIAGVRANHFLDCEVYGLCAARGLGVALAGFARPPEQTRTRGYARRAAGGQRRSGGSWRIGR